MWSSSFLTMAAAFVSLPLYLYLQEGHFPTELDFRSLPDLLSRPASWYSLFTSVLISSSVCFKLLQWVVWCLFNRICVSNLDPQCHLRSFFTRPVSNGHTGRPQVWDRTDLELFCFILSYSTNLRHFLKELKLKWKSTRFALDLLFVQILAVASCWIWPLLQNIRLLSTFPRMISWNYGFLVRFSAFLSLPECMATSVSWFFS